MSLLPFMIPDIAEAGCDEAGRGCLCGPVSCAAVILPADFEDPGLNDSKQLDAAERQRLRAIIEEQALAWAVYMVPPSIEGRMYFIPLSVLHSNTGSRRWSGAFFTS